MRSLIGWAILIIGLWFAYQAGWFNSIINYFTFSKEQAGKEQVIQEADGSTTTVKYRNAIDLMLNKE